MTDFLIQEGSTYLDALKMIDHNTKGFVIVLDKQKKALGVLTDGDIRRAFIAGKRVMDTIVVDADRHFRYLTMDNSFQDTIDIFKDESINFLPVLDNEGRVINIITKKQMHSILLQDMNVDLQYDFLKIDEGLQDYEIFKRPWGFYKTTVMNDYFQSKVISVSPGQSLSLQSHKRREEYWIIAHGEGRVQIGESQKDIQIGDMLFIPKGCKHRLVNTGDTENLIVIEVQIGDYFGEDDIYRYEDVYGRVKCDSAEEEVK